MLNIKSRYRLLTSLFFSCLFAGPLMAQHATPKEHWEQYSKVEEAGFSIKALEVVKEQFEASQAASLMVVHKGKILLSYGDNSRRFMTHSIRKSFLNALYGIYVKDGQIKLNSTLKSLNIDDITPLSPDEKKATVVDLLAARSGIFLPAAYSPKGMEKNLPARGSHAPGTFWYYNNWDFNTLCTIFEQQTSQEIFAAFEEKIAKPLGMEDFRVSDGYYRYEKEKSMHPAYLFRMSARDMARFGLLYLNKGRWGNQELIPSDWIEKSTSPISKELGSFGNRGAYGYLWWVSHELNGQAMYYASGSGGHRIMVLPDSDLVIVHRVNTYEGKKVSANDILKLVVNILDAQMGASKKKPATVPYMIESNIPETYSLSEELVNLYSGSYKHPSLGYFTIRKGEKNLELHTSIGVFKLSPIDQNHLFPEDLETLIELIPAPNEESKKAIRPVFGANRSLEKAVFYY